MNRKLGILLWGLVSGESSDSINYQIAETILNNIYNLQDTSSGALANLCNVSKPSISRFYKELGFEKYYDFRLALDVYIVDQGKTAAYRDVNDHGMIHAYLNSCRTYMDALENNIKELELIRLVHSIAKSPKVYFMGHSQAGSTAFNLQYNLYEAKKMTTAVNDLREQKDIFNNLTGRELIVVFSVSGRFFQDYFNDNVISNCPADTKIYMITSNPEIDLIEGMTVINTRTTTDIAGGNISLEMLANIIFLKYKNYVEMN